MGPVKKVAKREKKHDPVMMTMANILKALAIQAECLKKNCKIYKDAFEKKKKPYINKMLDVLSDKKLSLKTKNDKMKKIQYEILKIEEMQDLSKCQLQKCQKEFVALFRLAFNSPPFSLAKDNKKSPYYAFYHKYVHLLKKKNIVYDDVKDMDIDRFHAQYS